MDADVPRHRPYAFDKMEALIKEMQDPETGVPVRSQKLFLTYIPSAFMGYDLVEWLMERFNLDETNNGECCVIGTSPWIARRRISVEHKYAEKLRPLTLITFEAINLANQLCLYGYFFPVNDSKNLVLKDDSSLYRFQSPYYWPWSARVSGGSSAPTLGPDNVEYAIYLVKRTLRNKQRHGLEEYELEALANLKKNLAGKWDFITMQAEEQVRLAKDRKKGDKIVSDSQERAYWRVARPPPGMPSALEPCPVPVRVKQRQRKKTIQQLQREIEHLKLSLDRTRVKTSIALEALLAYSETFTPYDPWLTPPQPSNPWVSDDTIYWQINSPIVEIPSEKRVQRWALSIEELVSDPTGLQEFTSFLRKEYSHENIRFWLAVMDLRRSSIKQIPSKLDEIYEEFLKPGAPCEINIDGATAEKVSEGLRSGSRFALDHAAEHVYSLLLKKDCYPRFIRSDHFQRLLTEGRNVHQKKAKFFNFGGGQVKKKPGSTGVAGAGGGGGSGSGGGLTRRRGSDRSLSGSAHELAVCAAQPPRPPEPPPHSHSQSNLCEIPFRDPVEDEAGWEAGAGCSRRQDSAADSGSSSSDVSVMERRRLPQQSTLDGGLRGAPTSLRRLSAVEPRHLAPLASPTHEPRPPTAVTPSTYTPHPHPTPTISVSSAPDEESVSPEEPRSFTHSDEPSSVFASADATPTDPSRPVCDTFRTDISKVDFKVPSVERTDSRDSEGTRSSEDVVTERGTLSREPSTIKETSPASSRDVCSECDLPKVVAATDRSETTVSILKEATSLKTVVSSSPVTAPVYVADSSTAFTTDQTVCHVPDKGPDKLEKVLEKVEEVPENLEKVPEKLEKVPEKLQKVSIKLEKPTKLLETDLDKLENVEECLEKIPITLEKVPDKLEKMQTKAEKEDSEVAHSSLIESSRLPIAPLAVSEDTGVDDDNVDKVPSAPMQRVPDDPKTVSESDPQVSKSDANVSGVSKAASEPDASKKIAHKDELSSNSESNIVRSDNKGVGDRKRNDICPWEDDIPQLTQAPPSRPLKRMRTMHKNIFHRLTSQSVGVCRTDRTLRL